MIDDLIPVIVDIYTESGAIKIYPIADLHYGSPQFMDGEWEKFVAKLKTEPDSYIVIAGDMLNNAIEGSVGHGVYHDTVSPSEQKRWLAKQLEPIKDRILCGTSGNHCKRSYSCDADPLYDVFVLLGIENRFRENACFLAVRFTGENGSINGHETYTFVVTHGVGNSMYIGSSANKAERYGTAIDGIDCVIYGHTHKPLTFPVGKLFFDTRNKKVIRRQFTVVCATSWLDYGGYAVKGMFSPTAFKQCEIWIKDGQGIKNKEIRVLQ